MRALVGFCVRRAARLGDHEIVVIEADSLIRKDTFDLHAVWLASVEPVLIIACKAVFGLQENDNRTQNDYEDGNHSHDNSLDADAPQGE